MFSKPAHTLAATAALLIFAGQALGSDLVYHPVNPNFGGNPFNGSFLLETAAIQNGHEAKDKSKGSAGGSGLTGANGLSSQQQFVNILQSRLLSDMASKVTDAIFGEDAKESGEFRYGSQVVSFARGLDSIDIDIFNEATGERTQVSVPSTGK
jgi:curli production assembly/transport component CsgF